MSVRPWLASAILIVIISGFWTHAAEDGFVSLLKGNDPRQFELVGIGPDAITIADGEVRLSGRPNGYFATKESYRNAILRFSWRYERPSDLADDARFPGNSGVLIHIQEPHRVWPRCIQAQLMNADAGHTFAIGGATLRGDERAASSRAEALKRAIKPVGEWNEMEVVCRDGSIACTINGIVIDRGTGAAPDRGLVGFQSEGSPIRFRNPRIKPLD